MKINKYFLFLGLTFLVCLSNYTVFAVPPSNNGPTASCGGPDTNCIAHTCSAPSGKGASCISQSCSCNCSWYIGEEMQFDAWICVPNP